MKAVLLAKKQELEAQFQREEAELNRLREQSLMTKGAWHYNEMLLRELAEKEKAGETNG